MNRQARRWAAAAALLLLVAGGSLAFGQASGTFALFSAETKNPNAVFQGSWVPQIQSQASSLVSSGSYNQAQLSWSLGTIPSSGNPITGYSLEYAPGGSSGSASCGTYAAFSTPSSSPVNVTGTDISQWWCFRIHATTANVWTSPTVTFTPQRLFVPINTVVLTNGGGTAGSIEAGDTIAITFNQTPSNPGTITVSTDSTAGTITIGGVGTISGLTIGANKSYDVSTSGVSGSTLTITLGVSNNGSSHKPTTVGGLPGTFAGGSFSSSGGQNVCTAAACTIQTSGSF